MNLQTKLEIEAAAFRRLQQHLITDRPDVQNIDLMNQSGFCRNCLSRWYQEAAKEAGVEMSKDEAREAFYTAYLSINGERHTKSKRAPKLRQVLPNLTRNGHQRRVALPYASNT